MYGDGFMEQFVGLDVSQEIKGLNILAGTVPIVRSPRPQLPHVICAQRGKHGWRCLTNC
jgi:hypothetical protein